MAKSRRPGLFCRDTRRRMREAGMSARGSVSQNCKQLPCTPPFALHNAVCASRALCNVADGSGVVKVQTCALAVLLGGVGGEITSSRSPSLLKQAAAKFALFGTKLSPIDGLSCDNSA